MHTVIEKMQKINYYYDFKKNRKKASINIARIITTDERKGGARMTRERY